MQTLLPNISYPSGIFTAVLVHAEEIIDKLGCTNLLSVAKTKILVHPRDEWELLLVEGAQEVALLCSSDIEVSEPTYVDLIDVLGHKVSLARWHLLCLKTNVDRGLYITYLAV